MEEVQEKKSHNKRKRLSVNEKLMIRICLVFVIFIISLLSFSNKAYNVLEETSYLINDVSSKTEEQFSLMQNDLNKIQNKTDEYIRLINNVKELTEIEESTQKSRIIPKDSIPNMLNKIMNLIPREVKIISIINSSDSKQILIEVESEKYEQLGYFSSILKKENVLKNIKSTSGTKVENVIRVIIEGELP